MPITLECPRCKQKVAVPTKKAGSYVACPHCKGRFWVPELGAPGSTTTSNAAALGLTGSGSFPKASPPAAPAPASEAGPSTASVTAPIVAPVSAPVAAPIAPPPTRLAPPTSPTRTTPPSPTVSWFRGSSGSLPPVTKEGAPGGSGPPAAAPQVSTPSGPPAAALPHTTPSGSPVAPPRAPSAKKVARFIATETAQSGLMLAEDGKLPTLRLKEPGENKATDPGAGRAHPLLLFIALAFSAITTVVLLLMPTGTDSPGRAGEKQAARREIEERYIAGMDREADLAPYQIHLREALQAHARRDFAEERRHYRRVLDMLRAERGRFDQGLTGSPAKDETLEKLITTLLSD